MITRLLILSLLCQISIGSNEPRELERICRQKVKSVQISSSEVKNREGREIDSGNTEEKGKSGPEDLPEESICYSVVDRPGMRKRHRFTRALTLTRYGSPPLNVSVVYLRRPKTWNGQPIHGDDTRFWRVDHAHDPYLQAVRATFLSSFLTKSLPVFSKYEEKKILFFGIGGASSNMYMRYQRPKVNITVVEEDEDVILLSKRWFGLIEDSRFTLLHEKTEKFLVKAAQEGSLYDVIVFDWLHAAGIPLAARIFADDLPKLTSRVISPTGVFIVHLADSPFIQEQTSTVLAALLMEFPYCISLRLVNNHRVLSCFKRRFSVQETQPFVNRFRFIADSFKFKTNKHFATMTLHMRKNDGATIDI